MPRRIIKPRTRFFVAVEGESEQSFVAWLQTLSEPNLHIHLDCAPVGGGGFKSMLREALRLHERRCRASGAYRDRFLIVDGDRAEQGDWSVAELKREAAKHGFTVCVQHRNHEGLLLRMMPGMEEDTPDPACALLKLRARWPSYHKPMNAQALNRRFALADLLRVAAKDPDLRTILASFGFL